MEKEYGGYLPLETGDDDYFSVYGNKNICRLNAARYAIVEAVKFGKYKKIWLPIYMCECVYDTLNRFGIKFDIYNINNEFFPILKSIGDDESVIITNYYGQKNESFYRMMIDKYHNVVFDNTQSFFCKPCLEDGVYNVYSPRKFVGVSDGAYLIGNDVNKIEVYEEDESHERATYLLESIECGTNSAYSHYLQNEDLITESSTKIMSPLTKAILKGVNYESIKEKRLNNYLYLCDELQPFNRLRVNKEAESPMVYPLLIESDDLRQRLVQNRVYVPQWWKWVINREEANDWEMYLSKYLLPIPIDQRYNINDMCNLVTTIERYI